jgi:hypothetical protein
MKAFFSSAVAYVLDPEARKLCPVPYPSGNAMSVREAKRNGLYLDNRLLTDDLLAELQSNAAKGNSRDQAIFKMAKWNLAMLGQSHVFFKKSDIEGVVKVNLDGAAHLLGEDHVVAPIKGIGDVLIDKLTRV